MIYGHLLHGTDWAVLTVVSCRRRVLLRNFASCFARILPALHRLCNVACVCQGIDSSHVPTVSSTTITITITNYHCCEPSVQRSGPAVGRPGAFGYTPLNNHSSCPRTLPRCNNTHIACTCALPLPIAHPHTSLVRLGGGGGGGGAGVVAHRGALKKTAVTATGLVLIGAPVDLLRVFTLLLMVGWMAARWASRGYHESLLMSPLPPMLSDYH